jgi:hypothetical protein
MTQITINSVIGFVPPFSGYACNVYGNSCYYMGEINTIPETITLPSQFDLVPAIGLKLIDSTGCERFEVVLCTGEVTIQKQFQDGDNFFFMDLEIYQFQN